MSQQGKHRASLAFALLVVGVMAAIFVWGTGDAAVLAADGDLVAYKRVSSEEVPPGQTVQYTIVVTNVSGDTVSNVVVADALDPLLGSEIAVDASGWIVDNTSAGYITFTRPSLAAGDVVTAVIEAVLSPASVGDTQVDNLATFSADGVSEDTTNVASFTVSATPDIQVQSPDNGALVTARPGQTVAVSGKAWTEFSPPPIPDAPVIDPISYSPGAPSYKVDWNDVPTADYYVVYESEDGVFDLATDAVATPSDSESIFVGKPVGTYLYRAQTFNASGQYSRLSNMQGVTVTTTGVLAFTPSTSDVGIASIDAGPAITVQVSVDGGGSWLPATVTDGGDWWDWTFDWEVPEGDDAQQVLQARAAYESVDDWAMDSITVTIDNDAFLVYFPVIFKRWPPIPYGPVLNDIEIIGDGDDLRLSWTYSGSAGVPNPTDYHVQQASDAAFTANVEDHYGIVGLTTDLSDRPGGLLYYRVRGQNSYGYGDWSNVKSVALGRYYDFEGSTQGWFIARSDEGEGQQLPPPVELDGDLYHLVVGKADFSIVSPMEEGPVAPYTLETNVDIVDDRTIDGVRYRPLTGMTYGIIFGGNDASPCPATRYDPTGCLNQYYRILVTYDQGNGQLKWSLKRIEYHDGDSGGGAGRGSTLIDWAPISGFSYSATGWNTWRVEVTRDASSNIKIYFNDRQIGSATDHSYLDRRYFGTFLASTKELGSVATKYEYFEIQ